MAEEKDQEGFTTEDAEATEIRIVSMPWRDRLLEIVRTWAAAVLRPYMIVVASR